MVTRRQFVARSCCSTGLVLAGCDSAHPGVRIGFLVKQPEEQWFQDEWRFAERAAHQCGFDLIPIGVPSGNRVLSAIDTLYARYAQGVIICAPDPRLGVAIRERAETDHLKLMSVDDRLIGADDQPIESIPHVGISARSIGQMAGKNALAEARRRGWDASDTGVLRLAFDSLETATERTMGGREAIVAGGFPASRIYAAPMRTTDTEGGFTAASPVITRQSRVEHWIILGLNDEAVLGGVRAAEGAGFGARDVIGVGIGGSGSAVAEFEKPDRTGFWGSVLLSPRAHGYNTSVAMYRWITRDIRPKPVTYTTGQMMTRDNFRALLAAANA